MKSNARSGEKYDYSEGASLKLRVNDVHYVSTVGTELNAKIAKIYEPSSASIIMEVVIITAQNTIFRAALKLFDKRFCPQLRNDLFLQPYSSTVQTAYLELIRTGDASRYLARPRDSESDRSSDEEPMADFFGGKRSVPPTLLPRPI